MNITFISPVIALMLLLSFNTLTFAKSEFTTQTVLKTDDVIWSFAFISAHEVLYTLREGRLIYANLKNNTQKELIVPDNIKTTGQGGLLDVHFKHIGGLDYVYLTFSTEHYGQLTTALTRGLWEGKAVKHLNTLFIVKTEGDSGRHFGSRLLFKDAYIYMTIGDRGDRDASQNLQIHNGKILRLTLDGKPAEGNPFTDSPHALPEIYSLGHRNPQGIDIDPVSGKLYNSEFGPRGGDEINHVEAGKNYGWPVITYGREYYGFKIGTTHKQGMEQPIAYWTPSISPSGITFYTGDKIPQWKNNLFLAALGSRHLRRLVLKDNKVIEQEALFTGLNERVRHVRTGLDGYLYFSTDSGKLMRVVNQ